MQIVAVQMSIAWEDKPVNLARARALLEAADIKPGALIVLPEMFATGFSMNVDTIAEPDGGPTERFLTELAVEYQSHIIAGVVRLDESGKGRNEAVIVSPTGRVIDRYCKMHPMTPAGESDHYVRGEGLITFRMGDAIVAPFICYDIRFPEIFRDAVQQDAQVMVVIANFPAQREAHWVALLTARAIENQAYVVGVNRCGSDPENQYSGLSMVIDPRGRVVADAGRGEGVLNTTLDLTDLAEYRQRFNVLNDMRGGNMP